MPSVHKSEQMAKIMILKLEGIIKKFPMSAASREYESVDKTEKNPSDSILGYVPESDEKRMALFL